MRSLVLVVFAIASAIACSAPTRSHGGEQERNDVERAVKLLLARPEPTVIAIGESSHDDPIGLGWRNAITIELVRRDAIHLILLESGFAEARKLDGYVLGRGSLTSSTIGEGFANGLGLFAENRALIEEVRKLNALRPEGARVRIAGVDLSAGGPWGSAPSMAPIECALEGLPSREKMVFRAGFEKAVQPGLEGAAVTPAHVAEYKHLSAMLRAQMPKLTSADQNHCLRIVEQGIAMLETLPPGFPGPALPPETWQIIEARDRAMAENVILLSHRGQGRPTLLLSHLSHVAKTPMVGPRWSGLSRSPRSTGHFLHARLGDRYRAMLGVRLVRLGACPPMGSKGDEDGWRIAADAPDGDCSFSINESESQVLNLPRSADIFWTIERDAHEKKPTP